MVQGLEIIATYSTPRVVKNLTLSFHQIDTLTDLFILFLKFSLNFERNL